MLIYEIKREKKIIVSWVKVSLNVLCLPDEQNQDCLLSGAGKTGQPLVKE